MTKEYTYWAGIHFYLDSQEYEVYLPEFSKAGHPIICIEDSKEKAIEKVKQKLKATLKSFKNDNIDFPEHEPTFPVDLQFTKHTDQVEISVTLEW